MKDPGRPSMTYFSMLGPFIAYVNGFPGITLIAKRGYYMYRSFSNED
jgi:hypothetical protein